jgi:hypothetical protein
MSHFQHFLTKSLAFILNCNPHLGIGDACRVRLAQAFLQGVTEAFGNSDLHFCIYGAFGVVLILRAATCRPQHFPGEAREQFAHGLVYLSLALFR